MTMPDHKGIYENNKTYPLQALASDTKPQALRL